MTPEEAAKVKVNDLLITMIRGELKTVEVISIVDWGNPQQPIIGNFWLRPLDKPKTDRFGNVPRRRLLSRRPSRVNWAPANECRKDPVTGNVFADWLEEHGFDVAALALRRAFPMARAESGGR